MVALSDRDVDDLTGEFSFVKQRNCVLCFVKLAKSICLRLFACICNNLPQCIGLHSRRQLQNGTCFCLRYDYLILFAFYLFLGRGNGDIENKS